MKTEILEGLNKPQQKAVEYCDGPAVVIAPPGSGKTQVIITKVAYLIDGGIIPEPFRILALTFTNDAAREMRTRLQRLGREYIERTYIGTYHAWGFWILRHFGYLIGFSDDWQIIEPNEAIDLMIESLAPYQRKVDQNTARSALHVIERWKRDLVFETQIQVPQGASEAVWLAYKDYQNRLVGHHKLDFQDILSYSLRILEEYSWTRELVQNAYRYVLVDEYQDTDKIQHELIKFLLPRKKLVFVVADDDQSIYRWRGARWEFLKDWVENYHAKVFKLQVNYRSPATLLKAAGVIVEEIEDRFEKDVEAQKKDIPECLRYGEFDDYREEAVFIAEEAKKLITSGYTPEEIAVIGRDNPRVLSPIYDILIEHNVSAFYPPRLGFDISKEVRFISALLRSLSTKGVAYSVLTPLIEAYPELVPVEYQEERITWLVGMVNNICQLQGDDPLGRSKLAIELIDLKKFIKRTAHGFAEAQEIERNLRRLISYIDVSIENGSELDKVIDQIEGVSSIRLMTCHASKGLEFDVVFFPGLEKDIFPSWSSDTSKKIEEDRRTFYVTITRARQRVYLTWAKVRRSGGRLRPREISPFIEDIPGDILCDLEGTKLEL